MLSDKDFWSVVYGTSKHILGRSLTEQENVGSYFELLQVMCSLINAAHLAFEAQESCRASWSSLFSEFFE